MLTPRTFLVLLFWLAGNSALQAEKADDLLGLWVTDGAESVICIQKADDQFFGRIVALKDPVYAVGEEPGLDGQPKIDTENPEPKLRKRPIIGLKLMEGFRFRKKKGWQGGRIYDPDNGKTYKCQLRLKPDGNLDVRGYVGIPLLGRTTLWQAFEDHPASNWIFPDLDSEDCPPKPAT